MALCASHIPPPKMGMERRKVMKFRTPTKLFEHFILGERKWVFVGFWRKEMGDLRIFELV